MSDRITTKAGVFESGDKDAMGVQYKDGRIIACRNSKLTEYAVAGGTEVICDRAFMNMKELRSIILPASLKAIGESEFSGCKALSDITIPDGVTEIRQATFRDCDALAAIELPASVTEIEKFAFGRGLTTLVVNAPEIKIDRYAFMNARDFSTLMVPAGTADYYRALLADMRVKADVEESETEDNEPRSMLDKFVYASADEANEMTKRLFKSNNNMEEEKKMKTITVEVFGYEKWFEPKDNDEEDCCYDVCSWYVEDGMIFTVDGKEYSPEDFSNAIDLLSFEQLEKYHDFNAEQFFEESGAAKGMLFINKAWTSINIEIPEGEDFDPKKAALVLYDIIYPGGGEEPYVCDFVYGGKIYDCLPGDSRGISSEVIWPQDSDDEDEGEDEDDDWNF